MTLQWAECSRQDIFSSIYVIYHVASFVHLSTYIGVKVVDFYMLNCIVLNVRMLLWNGKDVICLLVYLWNRKYVICLLVYLSPILHYKL